MQHVGSEFPDQGSNLCSLQWKCRVLTTGLPGKSHIIRLFKRIYNACTPMFTAALFTIARTLKQPKCPSTDEWIKKMWYTHTMEYYSAIKRNGIVPFAEMWMDLETGIQSEVSQKEKNK